MSQSVEIRIADDENKEDILTIFIKPEALTRAMLENNLCQIVMSAILGALVVPVKGKK